MPYCRNRNIDVQAVSVHAECGKTTLTPGSYCHDYDYEGFALRPAGPGPGSHTAAERAEKGRELPVVKFDSDVFKPSCSSKIQGDDGHALHWKHGCGNMTA